MRPLLPYVDYELEDETVKNEGTREVTLDYVPREQFLGFHQRDNRWACIVAHRRAGKTVSCVNELVIRALYTTKTDARFGYISPSFTMSKDIAWTYLKNATRDFAVETRESDLRIKLHNGAWITLYGSDNPNRLRGLYFDGIVLDEFGDCRPSLWGEVLLATLLDRRGWAIFIGTPRGRNHFYEIYKRSKEENDWFSLTLKADSAGILDADQIKTMRDEMTEEEYSQEMLCSFDSGVRGAYYADQIGELETAGQIAYDVCEYDPTQRVNVASDIGFSDSTAMWFWQTRADGIAIIDYEEDQGKPLSHYEELLKAKPYEYERIWLPHDARAKTLQTGRSTIEQMLDAGFPCAIAPRLSVQDGINAARKILEICWINTATCYYGVEALRAYRRKYDEIKKVFTNAPLHDWSSDGSDAFRYFALVAREAPTTRDVEVRDPKKDVVRPITHTLDELYASQGTNKRQYEKLRI